MKDFKGKNELKKLLWFLRAISGYDYVKSRKALKSKTPLYLIPVKKDDSRFFYQLSFWKEFYEYYWGKTVLVPANGGGKNLCFWNLDFAWFPLRYNYDAYFKEVIKSPERALIRKAIKNGYTCREINYDEHLDAIHEINTSKEFRMGKRMIDDYAGKLKPRQSVVGAIGQEIHTFGCFDNGNHLVAYYMFEHFGENVFHTVKGIGHAEHLKFGIMNYLFAFSIDNLYGFYPDGKQILLYGPLRMGGGLSRFKRNVGCKFGCPTIKGSQEFYKDFEAFRKKYKIHDDTGLNFVLEYMK